MTDIADIGIPGRFPDAPNIATYWNYPCNDPKGVQPLLNAELALPRANEALSPTAPNDVMTPLPIEDASKLGVLFFGMFPSISQNDSPPKKDLSRKLLARTRGWWMRSKNVNPPFCVNTELSRMKLSITANKTYAL